MIFEASDSAYFVWYQAAAAFFLVALAFVVRRRRRGPADKHQLLILSTLLLGLPYFETAAVVYASGVEGLIAVGHIASLSTHILGVAWNCTTVLVVASACRPESLTPWQRAFIIAPFVISAVALIAIYVYLAPGPSGSNFMLYIRETLWGKVYITVFTGCLVVSKILIITIFVVQLQHFRRHEARYAVCAVVTGSIGILIYALFRVALLFEGGSLDSVNRWNTFPTYANTVGAVLYVSGVVFPHALASAGMCLRNINNCVMLTPFVTVCAGHFRQLVPPTVPPMHTPHSAALRLLEYVAFLSDCAVLARRAGGHTSDPSAVDSARYVGDTYDDFCIDRDWLLTLAATYRRTIRGRSSTREERAAEVLRLLSVPPPARQGL